MKTVVITGSTRGIGRGLAENFLTRGCRVVISARKQSAVDAVVSELSDQYGSPDLVAGYACDITKAYEIQALWDFAKQTFDSVDVWINNAGMSIPRSPLHQQSVDDLGAIVATNLTGLLLANSLVLKNMHEQGAGQIWNMEGFGSNGQTAAGMVAYGATKRALNYLNKALQKEIKGSPLQVCTLSPGIVVTELLTGDYDLKSTEWQKTKKVLNILGDTVETVTPYLVDGILQTNKTGAKVAWLTTPKALGRFLTAGFSKRDLFSELEAQQDV